MAIVERPREDQDLVHVPTQEEKNLIQFAELWQAAYETSSQHKMPTDANIKVSYNLLSERFTNKELMVALKRYLSRTNWPPTVSDMVKECLFPEGPETAFQHAYSLLAVAVAYGYREQIVSEDLFLGRFLQKMLGSKLHNEKSARGVWDELCAVKQEPQDFVLVRYPVAGADYRSMIVHKQASYTIIGVEAESYTVENLGNGEEEFQKIKDSARVLRVVDGNTESDGPVSVEQVRRSYDTRQLPACLRRGFYYEGTNIQRATSKWYITIADLAAQKKAAVAE